MQKGLIWVGTDDGLVQITKDAGATWTNVTPKGIPEWIRVNIIDPSHHNAAAAYVAADQHQLDDFRPYIYKTSDAGKTWVKITTGLPDNAYVHSVREDPSRRGLLFAGTEIGIYVSFDDGAQWQPLQLNLPRTPVYDLQVKNGDLVVATHGRGFYILDDIEPLRTIGADTETAAVHLFTPRPAIRLRIAGGRAEDAGENAPNGAIVDYYFKEIANAPVTLQILGGDGVPIRSYSSAAHPRAAAPLPERPGGQTDSRLPARVGMNRFIWDLRYEPPAGVDGAVYMEGSQLAGPMVLPGDYTVRLKVGDRTVTQPLHVKSDPRLDVDARDLQKQLEFGLKIRDLTSRTHSTVTDIRALKAQLASLTERLRGDPRAAEVLRSAHEMVAKASAIEEVLFQVKKTSGKDSFNYGGRLNDMLIALGASVERADAAPTRGQYDVLDMLVQRVEPPLSAWRNIITNDLAALNKTVHQLGIALVDVGTLPR